MRSKDHWKPILFVTIGCIAVLAACFSNGMPSSTASWIACAGAVLAQSSVVFLLRPSSSVSSDESLDLEERQHRFDEWQQARTEELEQESERLLEKQRMLTEKAARYQEFIEYPVSDETSQKIPEVELRLSEQDRKVHQLLEDQAERVYEAIRNNEYSRDGSVDLEKVTQDVQHLVRAVAQVYNPASSNPLLETSFEQLARAASRICLHSLVLLEQLPLDVKQYNINEMYGYIQKAVNGYGTYQQVAPWLKHLTRGAYVGRMAAGTNPVTLGAWWLATEVTRRGATRLVENVVDRQAVAVLHDIVAILGVETANIYGPGFRQRDAAWVYGTELTELLLCFPMSRESLSHALQQITDLPLSSEYDRVYLYRCLALRRSAGSTLSDPAMLLRSEREAIASRLESFFDNYVHGIEENEVAKWIADVESRLDLKLKLGNETAESHSVIQAEAALIAVHSFLTSVIGITSKQAVQISGRCELMTEIPVEERPNLLGKLEAAPIDARFEPPDLDPSSEITTQFLNDLFACSIRCEHCDSNIENLLVETAGYFRRSHVESAQLLDSCYRIQLEERTMSSGYVAKSSGSQARAILRCLHENESLTAAYQAIDRQDSSQTTSLEKALLVLLQNDAGQNRAILIDETDDGKPAWISESPVELRRRRGYLIDDCEIHGGVWSGSAADFLIVSGSMTGGGFNKMFAPLIAAFGEPK